MREPSLQRLMLFFGGVALVASIVVPTRISPFELPFSVSGQFWSLVLFPIIAGGAYLLVSAAPPNIREKIPPVVIQWIPFGVSFYGITTLSPIFPLGGFLYLFAYSILLFGLLSRIARPTDQTARVVIAIGAGMLALTWLGMLGDVFKFSGPALGIVAGLIHFFVTLLGALCVLFVVPPQKLPPALQAVDAFGPLICAILIAWLGVGYPLFLLLIGLIHEGAIVTALLAFARYLLYILAYMGVFMTAAPSVYESIVGVPILRRSQLATVLMLLVPLFGIYWIVETKEEIKKKTNLPLKSGWWLAVPIMNVVWLWKWAEGVEAATGYGKMPAFLLTAFVGPVGVWIVHGKLQQAIGGGAMPNQPMAQGYPPPGYPPQGGYPGGPYPA